MSKLGNNTNKKQFTLKSLANKLKRGVIKPNHPLQRYSGRWDQATKNGMVGTSIKGEDINPLIICHNVYTGDMWLIDGLQRLSTLISYRENGFKVTSNVEYPVFYLEGEEVDIRNKRYSDLPEVAQEALDDFMFPVTIYECEDDEMIGYTIRRYNQSKNMNTNEKGITHLDRFADIVKRITNESNVFTQYDLYKFSQVNAGLTEKIVVETIMCAYHIDRWNKNHVKCCDYLNENATEKQFLELEKALEWFDEYANENLSDEACKLFTSKNSYVLFTMILDAYRNNKPVEKVVELLNTFEQYAGVVVNETTWNEVEANRNTKDKAIVTAKVNTLKGLLNKICGIDITYNNETVVEADTEEEITTEPEEEVVECDSPLVDVLENSALFDTLHYTEAEKVITQVLNMKPTIEVDLENNALDFDFVLENVAEYLSVCDKFDSIRSQDNLATMIVFVAEAMIEEVDDKIETWVHTHKNLNSYDATEMALDLFVA